MMDGRSRMSSAPAGEVSSSSGGQSNDLDVLQSPLILELPC